MSTPTTLLPFQPASMSTAQPAAVSYRMVTRIAKSAAIPRHISPHSLRHAAITNALDAGVPLRDAQILARHATPHLDPRWAPQPDRKP